MVSKKISNTCHQQHTIIKPLVVSKLDIFDKNYDINSLFKFTVINCKSNDNKMKSESSTL